MFDCTSRGELRVPNSRDQAERRPVGKMPTENITAGFTDNRYCA